ncbi:MULTISPECIES: hypothetical protein [unclassified Synechocystis]|uniref:hypothetical protein n=1 Tax=unclassified Synechocystis TaxID=2640012 RepID=UPI00041571A5|nr:MULTISPECIES: hypothetical protein [unclassified Synechocystis]AIE74181.1 hypothetical protein D082_16530 [Synechocystis sp. PCC 6714]MCT0252814.1 hypothetical protein [Synechocystis sp. CS-94]
MERKHLLTAIAILGLVASFTPGANAQFRNYNRYSNYNNYNNPGDRIGTPGFSQPIFMPNRKNSYPSGYYKDYNRNYRGNDELTIINGGNNCINCRVDGWGRRGNNSNNNWHHQRHGQDYFYY